MRLSGARWTGAIFHICKITRPIDATIAYRRTDGRWISLFFEQSARFNNPIKIGFVWLSGDGLADVQVSSDAPWILKCAGIETILAFESLVKFFRFIFNYCWAYARTCGRVGGWAMLRKLPQENYLHHMHVTISLFFSSLYVSSPTLSSDRVLINETCLFN